MMNLFLLLWILFEIVHGSRHVKIRYKTDVYPNSIPKYKIRTDVTTKRAVHSGLLHTLPNKSSLVEFRRHLQCSVNDPNLNYNNGMISALRLAPPTVDSYKAFCSAVEMRKFGNWQKSNDDIEQWKQGQYNPKRNFNKLSGYSRAELVRVINGSLYYDWPWGVERFDHHCNDQMMTLLIEITLTRITDMKDSAFFLGGADPVLPANTLVPYFAFSSAEHYADMVFPWCNMWTIAHNEYLRFRRLRIPFTESGYLEFEKSYGYRDWKHRVPKAAIFGSMMRHRQIIFDVARLNPKYIDALANSRRCVNPWHPLSTEQCEVPFNYSNRPSAAAIQESLKLPAGYVLPLYNISSVDFISYQPGAYKYVIVPLGEQATMSTSGRIANLLTFSGAVILMPRNAYRYFFSAQLLPWVHYVPVSFTGADLVEKIQWLRDHDDMAQQIAQNGRNFARSYLRLEDYFCYVAHLLETMSELAESGDIAKKPFNPRRMQRQCNPSQHVLYEYPV